MILYARILEDMALGKPRVCGDDPGVFNMVVGARG